MAAALPTQLTPHPLTVPYQIRLHNPFYLNISSCSPLSELCASVVRLKKGVVIPDLVSLSPSPKCPTDVETLTSLMLKDLPSYANRVMQRSRRLSRNTGSMSYVITAGRPEFEPLTLGPGEYTPPTTAIDLEPPKQVFFTTLERQYRAGKASYLQLYHWLFLAQTADGWRIAMMFSQIGSSGRPPTPPLESSRGVVGQAVAVWLRDCRVGAIRGSSPRSGTRGEEQRE